MAAVLDLTLPRRRSTPLGVLRDTVLLLGVVLAIPVTLVAVALPVGIVIFLVTRLVAAF